jgi:hypothetical protein
MTTQDKFYFVICGFALLLCLITHEWLVQFSLPPLACGKRGCLGTCLGATCDEMVRAHSNLGRRRGGGVFVSWLTRMGARRRPVFGRRRSFQA